MTNDSNNFREIIPYNKTILCLDLGKKRIGLAISDVNQKIASPYMVIEEKKFSEVSVIIEGTIKKFGVGSIKVGDPINMDGSPSQSSQSAKDLAINLSKNISIPITMWDERLSSRGAFSLTKELNVNTSKKVSKLDENSAAFILQGALDFLNRKIT